MSERLISWAVKRHFESLGHGVKMARIRVGSTEIDSEAVRDGEKIAIEIKTPSDGLAQGFRSIG